MSSLRFSFRKPAVLTASISAILVASAFQTAFPATNTFTGSGSWNTSTNWSTSAAPSPTDDLFFTSGGTSTLDASYTVQTLSFDIGGSTVSINANGTGTTGQTLTLNGSSGNDPLGNSTTVVDLSSGTTGTVNIGVANGVGTTTVMLTNSEIINVSNALATLNFGANSIISGADSSILFGGQGTLVLAGANTFGGAGSFISVNGGTLAINNASALGDAGNSFNINGGTIDNTSGAAITTSNYAQIWGSDFTFAGTNALNLGTGAVSMGSSTSPRTVTVNGTGANGTLTVGGIISGTGGLTKAGTGTLVLTGANTYTGGTTISAGKLQIGNGSSNGTLNGTYVIASGATLNWNQGASPNQTVPWTNISGAGTFSLDDATTSGSVTYGTNIGLTNNFTGTLALNDAARPAITAASNLGGASTVVITGNAQLLLDPGSGGVTLTQSFAIGGIGARSDHPDGAIRSTSSSGSPTNTISGNITLLSNSGLTTQNNHANNLVITGIIDDGGNGYNLAINPEASSESITLSGANTYSGQTILSGANAVGKLVLGNSLALQNSTLSISAGSLSFSSSVSSDAFTLGGLTGSSAIGLADNAATPNPVALAVGNNNSSTSYSGALSGAGSLSKIGAGTLTLSGASTYTGQTTISSGTLELNATGSLAASPVTVGAGTLQIDSTGKTFNSLAIADSAANLAIAAASGQTTTITNTLLQSTNYTVTPIFLTTPAVGTINLLTTGGFSGSGTATLNLSQYGPTRVTGALEVSGNILQLTITTGPANLVWSNGMSTGNWNLAGDTNFSNGSSPDVFKAFDTVTFDNTTTPGTVNLTGILAPSSITVNNTSGTYAFSGTGSIVGQGALTKSGAGALMISTSNNYAGGTNLNGGIVTVGAPGALGTTGTISFGGGTLQYSAANTTDYSSRFATASGQAYNVDTNGQNVTWASVLTSSGGTLTKSDPGTLTLAGANTFTGPVNVNAGVLTSSYYASAANSFLGGPGSAANRRTVNIASGSQVTYTNSTSANSFLNFGGNVASGGYGSFYDFNISGTLAINDGAGVSQILQSTYNLSNGGVIINTGVANNGTYGFLFGWSGAGGGNINVSGTGNQITADRIGFFNGATITTNVGADLTVTSVIGNGNTTASVLNKAGAGTLILTGASTYTGATTVSAGTLLVSGSISGSTTTVSSGATLGGTGSLKAVTVNSGGSITAGASVGAIGTLQLGGNLNLNGSYQLTLNSTLSTADDLNVTGNLTLGGGALTITDLGTGGGTGNLTIAQYTGSLTGTFGGLAEGALVDSGRYTIDYGQQFPGTVTLLAIPEPSSLMALFGGFGMLAGLQRFRRRC